AAGLVSQARADDPPAPPSAGPPRAEPAAPAPWDQDDPPAEPPASDEPAAPDDNPPPPPPPRATRPPPPAQPPEPVAPRHRARMSVSPRSHLSRSHVEEHDGRLDKQEDTVLGGKHFRIRTGRGAVHVWVPPDY